MQSAAPVQVPPFGFLPVAQVPEPLQYWPAAVARRGGAVVDAAAQDRRSSSRRPRPVALVAGLGALAVAAERRRCSSRSCTGRPRCTACRWPSRGSCAGAGAVARPALVSRRDAGRRADRILVAGGHERAGAAARGQVAGLAGVVAVGVAADAVRAVAAGALAERAALLSEQLLALLVGVARLIARTGVVGLADRHGAARAERGGAGDVARLAGARALRGGQRAADAVDAVARRAARRRSPPSSPTPFGRGELLARYSQISCGP